MPSFSSFSSFASSGSANEEKEEKKASTLQTQTKSLIETPCLAFSTVLGCRLHPLLSISSFRKRSGSENQSIYGLPLEKYRPSPAAGTLADQQEGGKDGHRLLLLEEG